MNTAGIQKTALVTGAGSGIGQAVALRCNLRATRWLRPDVDWPNLKRPHQLQARRAIKYYRCQPMSANPIRSAPFFGRMRETFGRLDVLFNNAGRSAPAVPLEDLSYDEWTAPLAVNLNGVFLCAQEAIKLMKTQVPRGGRIINNGSISSYIPRPNSAPYTATKHAVTGLTKCI